MEITFSFINSSDSEIFFSFVSEEAFIKVLSKNPSQREQRIMKNMKELILAFDEQNLHYYLFLLIRNESCQI